MTAIAFTGDVGFSRYFKEGYKKEDILSKEVVDFLASTDYTVVNVEGALDTLRHARENGCLTVGLGENADLAAKPLFLEKDGVKIGLISVTYDHESAAGENGAGSTHISDNARIKAQIEEVKSQNAWCVVIPHGFEGLFFKRFPTLAIRTKGHYRIPKIGG